jgi:hypothetical protein
MLTMWSVPRSAKLATARKPAPRPGATALRFERRDYQPSSHALHLESSEHLIFVSSGAGRIAREYRG